MILPAVPPAATGRISPFRYRRGFVRGSHHAATVLTGFNQHHALAQPGPRAGLEVRAIARYTQCDNKIPQAPGRTHVHGDWHSTQGAGRPCALRFAWYSSKHARWTLRPHARRQCTRGILTLGTTSSSRQMAHTLRRRRGGIVTERESATKLRARRAPLRARVPRA